MKKYKALLGFMLSLTLILDASGLHTLAAQAQENRISIEDGFTVSFEEAVSDGDVSAADISGSDVTGNDVSVGDVSGNAVTAGDVTANDISAGDVSGCDVSDGNADVISSGDVSANDVSEGDVTGGDISGGDVSGNDISAGDITDINDVSSCDAGISANYLASGKYCGMTWTLTKGGLLTISGKCNGISELYSGAWSGYADKITSVKITAKNVANTGNWFRDCKNLKSVDMKDFDTSRLEYIHNMFRDCYSLETLDVSKWNTENIVNYKYAFLGCHMLKELDISGWKAAEKIDSMSGAFGSCSSLQELDFSNFTPSVATDISNMMEGCTSLKSVDLSGFANTKINECYQMFNDCPSLKYLDMSFIDMQYITTDFNFTLISGCGALAEFKTPINVAVTCYLYEDLLDEEGNLCKTLPQGLSYSITLRAPVYDIEAIETQPYTGKAVKPVPVVSKVGNVLTPGVDYTVSYKNNTNAASADADKAPTVIIKGKGVYKGTLQKTFTIEATDISDADVSILAYKANGKKQSCKPVVTLNGKKLKSGKEYVVEYPDTMEGAYTVAGKYNVIIRGIGNYQGEIPVVMEIVNGDVIQASKLKVASIPAYEYVDGIIACPTPKVTYKGKELVAGQDYTIDYLNNTVPGKATMIITGLQNTEGKYVVGSVKKNFTIKGIAMKKAKITYEKKATYNGSQIKPKVTVTIGKQELVAGTDYHVTYRDNIDAGKATIEITGNGMYYGTVKKTFTIKPLYLDESEVSITSASAYNTYNGTGVTCGVYLIRNDTKERLGSKDYKLSYKNNVKVNEDNPDKPAIVIAKGIGNYRFTAKGTFTINKTSLSTDFTPNMVSKSVPDVFLEHSKSLLSEPVLINAAGKKLKKNKDYIIKSYTVNGEAINKNTELDYNTVVTVEVEGIGNYYSTATMEYRVAKRDIAKTKVKVFPRTYQEDGSYIFNQGLVNVTDTKTKQCLAEFDDYNCTYTIDRTNPRKATVTIWGINNYSGTKTVKVKINPYEF